MKSENNSEIRKQQLLFTASLLSVVVAVFLFTSAFFWAAKAETPWFNNARKDQQVFKSSVKDLSERIAILSETLQAYEEMPDKTTTRAMSKEDEFKAELDEMLKDFDKYDNANKDEIQLIKTAMGQVKLMLQSKLIEARKLSEVEIELKKCQEETKKLNEQMKDIKSSLGI
jgi:DNA repair exonuclease SbcCD ATPase subunit